MTSFSSLPDYMDYRELKKYFIEYLVIYANNTDEKNKYYALDELYELSDRQWHTYEIIDEDIKKQLEKYLISVIDLEDEKIMDIILCIIPRVGLDGVFDYILKNKDNIRNLDVKKNIEESFAEYGLSVNNPYSGM